MKRFILFLAMALFYNSQAFAAGSQCFLLSDKGHLLQQEGRCEKRAAPCSTFKIAISLMGYDDGILIDQTTPEWPFKEEYSDWLDVWKQPHNPTMWIKNSCVWYSQLITNKLGEEKFKHYVSAFDYGNQDVSGDKGKHNGLTRSWLSSSLTISPKEQMEFLQKLVANKLPVSAKAQELTRSLLFIEELENGWKLYGKTGSGNKLNKDGSKNQDRQIGWFIGWLEKEERHIIFVHYIEDDQKMETYASLRAKAAAKEKLIQWIRTNPSF
ncbi:MAG: blaD [Rickettsiales bacterium]|jgi:beta-lactamase class D|nr:blaD [Rickettsiales bacterium]